MTVAVLEARTVGEGWLLASRAILERGAPATYDGQATRELALLALVVERPASDDAVIAALGDDKRLAWSAQELRGRRRRAGARCSKSYAARLFNYAGTGRDQIAWVVDRLRTDPASRSATITTFQPLTDTAYLPCVSMLDFWLPAGALELIVYAHSLDFGKKAYANLVELARLQEHVAGELEVAVGRQVVHAKSAHVYEPEWALMAQLADALGPVS